ncbi:hypothetical protein [Agromyces larvae]|uniref:MazG-like nucleotide pyrophosphohydrolase n=1 Tax=Agromyces larvae TaxID=2929802 RepID=A0ABY4C4R5_9MICO|nr:hypothetical protein [Agromyces larvae]UOE45959.1 hypothetical protein MTO99_09520 [Agromyces larvae]
MTHLHPITLNTLRNLQAEIGDQNAAKGFHDRSTDLMQDVARYWNRVSEGWNRYQSDLDWAQANLRDHQIATLALIDTETAEAIEELRNGHPVDETYYHLGKDSAHNPNAITLTREYADGTPRKPEGVPSELADIVIRSFDFAARFGIDLAAAIDEKVSYNSTRERMHGRKL